MKHDTLLYLLENVCNLKDILYQFYEWDGEVNIGALMTNYTSVVFAETLGIILNLANSFSQ